VTGGRLARADFAPNLKRVEARVGKRFWLVAVAAMGLASCGRGRGPAGVDEHESPTLEARPADRAEVSSRRRPEVPGFPGLYLNDRTYGGTASWTAEGNPPAGDWYAPRPRPTAPPI
jgi:hypothetical protein